MRKTRCSLVALAAGIACMAAAVVALPSSAQNAESILKQAGINGGVVVHLGCGDGSLTAQLKTGEHQLVQGLDTDPADVATARRNLRDRGVYGPVSVDIWDGRKLPYSDDLVNLIVGEDLAQVSRAEMLRVLAPNGVALVRRNGEWERLVKPWPDAMDEWTHYFHDADGNPVADDSLVGPPRRLQWVGGPRWARHHDHMASMTSLVSANGRLFYIFDEGSTASIRHPSQWRLIARDAFNGTILWKREIDQWNTREYPLKSGPAHLLRRLVAVGDRVFVTLGIDAPAVALDAATGETVLTYAGSEHTREVVVSDGVAFLVADASPSRLPDWRRVSTYVWKNTQTANPGWGWSGQTRNVLAYDAATGKQLWKAEGPVAPCSLAVNGTRVVLHDGEKIVCLDRRNGKGLWESEEAPTSLPVHTNTGPRTLIYKDAVLFAGNNGKMSGWSLADGTKLWEQTQQPTGHMSLKDLFVVDGLVWTAAIANGNQDGVFTGYDALTGEKKREFPPDINLHWFHHRCYPSKATGKYLITARNGTEYIDLATEKWDANHWVRGGCIYGVMPCNGMTYASMHSCGCQLEAKLTGFNAMASGPVPQATEAELAGSARLQKGPAYAKVGGPAAGAADWPTYRHDVGRSGAASAAVAGGGGQGWETQIGGRLTPPTVAAGKLFAASIDTHTLHALDAATGKALWSYTAGGRIDSPPTYHKGSVLFGSADGYVYALRADDGALAWRFRGAPLDRRMMAWEQLESAWPVHGSVLVHDGVLYCTAGRNMYLDGGIRFIRLDPTTGDLLGEVVMDDMDPDSDLDMHRAYLEKTPGNTMPVALSDILSCDGRNLWMRSQKFDFEGKRYEIAPVSPKEQPNEDFHLFCQIGFLDDSYFFRGYWTYGRRVGGGYGGWFQAGRVVPSGRIMCYDDEAVYGFGRKMEYMVNASVVEYQLFAANKAVTQEAIERLGRADREMNSRSNEKNASSSDWLVRYFYPREDLSAARFQWSFDQPAMIARAMVVAGDTLFTAGPPDVVDERYAYRNPDDANVRALLARQVEALDGRHGGQLWAVSKDDGKVTGRYALDTIPVFDGMAAAGGRLYMATVDGRVRCLADAGSARLPAIDDQPLQILWDEPEDPSYLLPLPEPKNEDFATVTRCDVFSSELGYRLRAKGTKQVGLALNELAQPITGSATFKTRVRAVAQQGSGLRNGFLAFGDAADDASLVKCGARLQTQQALLIQGPLLDGGTSESAPIQAPDARGVEIVVKVDLKAQKVTYTANGVTLEAELERPLKSITHVGYAMDSATIDVAPIEIQRQ